MYAGLLTHLQYQLSNSEASMSSNKVSYPQHALKAGGNQPTLFTGDNNDPFLNWHILPHILHGHDFIKLLSAFGRR